MWDPQYGISLGSLFLNRIPIFGSSTCLDFIGYDIILDNTWGFI